MNEDCCRSGDRMLNTQIIVTAMGNMDDVEYLLIMRDAEF
jgi:hypothetical protein